MSQEVEAEAEAEARCGELVTRVNLVREGVAGARSALRSPPLHGGDYDEFPLQEDALARVRAALADVQAGVEEAEREHARVAPRCRPEQAERVRRVRDKLREEWRQLQDAYAERHERWRRCQAVWVELYAALEECGEWLDAGAGAGAGAEAERVRARVAAARRCGRSVVGACAAPLALHVQEQLDALEERWQRACAALQRLQWAEGAALQVRQVAELLATTPNPSDRTSLSIRLSLVKVCTVTLFVTNISLLYVITVFIFIIIVCNIIIPLESKI